MENGSCHPLLCLELAPTQHQAESSPSHPVPKSPAPVLASHPSSLGTEHILRLGQMLGGGRSVISSQTSKSLH